MNEGPHKATASFLTKRRIAFLATGFVLAVAVWLLIDNHDSTPMPMYHGRTAREWLYGVARTNQDAAMEAFHQMGSNAFPFLVHELERKDSARDTSWQWIYSKLPSVISRHFSDPESRNEKLSRTVFTLINVADSKAIPPLLDVLKKGDDEQRMPALRVLTYVVRPDDTNCLVPVMNCLRSKDYQVCIEATTVLERMNLERIAISQLTNFLSSTNAEARITCLLILSHIDPSNEARWAEILTNDPAWKASQRDVVVPPPATNSQTDLQKR
jgi:hypothetical protein